MAVIGALEARIKQQDITIAQLSEQLLTMRTCGNCINNGNTAAQAAIACRRCVDYSGWGWLGYNSKL